MSRLYVLRFPIPLSGGGYFRLFPYRLFIALAPKVIERDRLYNFLIHPWEIDPGFPRLAGLRADLRFRHYVNLRKSQSRLADLLKKFPFGPLRDLLPQGTS